MAGAVLGAFLRPYRVFSETEPFGHVKELADPETRLAKATEVIADCVFDNVTVLVTRIGGVFVRTDMVGLSEESFRERARIIETMNALVCDLSLIGEWAEPFAWPDLAQGGLIDDAHVQPTFGPSATMAPWHAAKQPVCA